METEKFKEVVYGPYGDTWKILKLLQHVGEGDFKYEDAEEYWKAVAEFEEKYKNNKFADFMVRNVLSHADNIIIRMNEGGNNE